MKKKTLVGETVHHRVRAQVPARDLRVAALAFAERVAKEPRDSLDSKGVVLWEMLGQAAVEYASAVKREEARVAKPRSNTCDTCGGAGAICVWSFGEGFTQTPCPRCKETNTVEAG